jgi:hypothetical protein
MSDKTAYECQFCGNKVEVEESDADAPECCRKPMTKAGPLPVCETSPTAEHSRMDDMGEPCDDGRAGS